MAGSGNRVPTGMTAAGDLLLHKNQHAGKNDRETHGQPAGDPMERLEKRGDNCAIGHGETLQQKHPAALGHKITQNIGPIGKMYFSNVLKLSPRRICGGVILL
ncbi:hypothetical protein [Endobacterium cereale]|jgi:hypothetical protein|uniref:hypothetical protein n=1 Tax=Endobacterium cereale TaxID=2663029 RepID=UPI002B49895A|nr:hypothetical protein [Endobacterium cereale]